MIIILVRHGEADGEGDSPLSAKGQQQAAAAAQRLSKIRITKVYSSDYLRAKGTFEEYQKLNPSIPVEVTPKLREIYRAIVGGPLKEGARPNRAEENTARAEEVFAKLLANDDREVIAVFAHGNVIRYYLAKALGVNPKVMWQGVLLKCGSISVIQVKNGALTVKLMDGADHLPHAEITEFYEKFEDTKYLP
jgi:serine/threonine-protein phosphatase PGAM5